VSVFAILQKQAKIVRVSEAALADVDSLAVHGFIVKH
jgi:hypothetical protein